MFPRILRLGRLLKDLLDSLMLTAFLALISLVLAVWLSGNLWVGMGAAVLGLGAGVAISRRLWRTPVTEPAAPPIAKHRYPGIQDEFERILARQRVLGFLLIAGLVVLLALRVADALDWRWPPAVPRERVVWWTLAGLAIVLPLGLLNWRCPRCRRNLGRSMSIRQCPRCGIMLRG